MSDLLYKKFVKRWETVTQLPPQRLGPLTPYYKMLVPRLKTMPWPALFVVSLALVLAIYFVLGSAVTFLVSILQRGF